MKRNLVLLAGKKFTGKDTVAQYLVSEKGYISFAIADKLKDQLSIYLTEVLKFTPEKFTHSDLYISENKEKSLGITLPDLTDFTVRKAMQWYGQTMKYLFGNFYWIKLLTDEILSLSNTKNCDIVISDCRFLYELKYFNVHLSHLYNIHQVKIKRETGFIDKDVSENGLGVYADSWFDFIFDNNGTIEQLQDQIDKMIQVIS